MKKQSVTQLLIAVALFLAGASTLFVMDETQVAVVTQFGRPVRNVTRPGLHAKLPIQSVTRFDARLRIYNPRPSELLTRDKKNLVVDNYVAWRVQDPERFLSAVRDTLGAERCLHDIVWARIRSALGNSDLSSIVSTKPGEVRLARIMGEVTAEARAEADRRYGIEVVDVGVRRINLPEQNKQSVFERMRAERERIARQYRAEGEEEALKIRAEADREKTRILSEAYRDAERIRGDGDAQATRIYAAAAGRDPSFYKMTRTLDAYRKFLNDKTTVILSSDSDLLRLFSQGRTKTAP
mgnify:CR=1 FL=1